MTYYAAPFYGEFGWEVALWAPHLRWLARHHCAGADIVAFCKPGHEALYEDFATAEPVTSVPAFRRVDCQNAWLEGGGLYDPEAEVKRLLRKQVAKKWVLSHRQMGVHWSPVPVCRQVEHILHGNRQPDPNRYAIHVRACLGKQEERNWNPEVAAEVVNELERSFGMGPVYIGTIENAIGDSAAGRDLRGAPLEEVIDELARCVFIVGPSSGPMHLANQCGVPAVWWSANEKDVARYAKAWNPFGLNNVQVDNTWNPSADEVILAIEEDIRGPV